MELKPKKTKLSIVIVYTNIIQLSEAVSCIEKQTFYPFIETILLDNRKNDFLSASRALNFGAKKSTGDVVVFMHQDVYLWDTKLLENYYNFLIGNPRSIVGIAGVAKSDEKLYYDFCETKRKLYRGNSTNGEIIPAISLDECMFAMMKSLWQQLQFDEEVCNNWHFYGADICFNNIINGGGKNYIISTRGACHESTGNPFNGAFRKNLGAIMMKYKGKLPRILTSCVNMKCTKYSYLKYCIISIMQQIKRSINKA